MPSNSNMNEAQSQHMIAQQRMVPGQCSGGTVEVDAKRDMVGVASMSTYHVDRSNVDAHLHVFSHLCHLPLIGCPSHGSFFCVNAQVMDLVALCCGWRVDRSIMDRRGLGRSRRWLPRDGSDTGSRGRTVRWRRREETEGERQGEVGETKTLGRRQWMGGHS